MKNFKDIEQGSAEWHMIRWGKIGGTNSKQLHVKTDTLLNSLVAANMESFDPDSEEGLKSAAMQRGNDLEPDARLLLSESVGVEFLQTGWLEREDCSIMGLSPDGLSDDGKVGCEIKCPSLEVHTRYIRENVIPSDYIHQVIQFFAVNDDMEYLWFCSYRPEHEIPLFKLKVGRYDTVNTGTDARPVMTEINTVAMNKRVLGLQLEEDVKNELKRIRDNQF